MFLRLPDCFENSAHNFLFAGRSGVTARIRTPTIYLEAQGNERADRARRPNWLTAREARRRQAVEAGSGQAGKRCGEKRTNAAASRGTVGNRRSPAARTISV
jgi:hypothetical protein